MKLINTTDALFLAILIDGPEYGVGIVRKLNKSTKGKVKIPLGTLYTQMARLKRKGFVDFKWSAANTAGGRQRQYIITKQGEKKFKEFLMVFIDLFVG